MPDLVDYVEGFVVLNDKSLHSSFTAFPIHLKFTSIFHAKDSSKVYFCIEFAVHVDSFKNSNTEQVTTGSL